MDGRLHGLRRAGRDRRLVVARLPVDGLAERGIGFKTVQEAIYLRNHVLSRLDVAAETGRAGRARAPR